jgi:hypothetical protein
MAANSTERLHHSSRSDKLKPSRQGVDDVRTGWRIQSHTGVGDGRRLPLGGPSSREGCIRQARGADMRVAGGAVRRDPVARRLSDDEVVRWAAHCVQSGDRLDGTFATLVVGRFDLGHYAKRRVTRMTVPSRSVLIARPLRSNTFSIGTLSERTSAVNS